MAMIDIECRHKYALIKKYTLIIKYTYSFNCQYKQIYIEYLNKYYNYG